MCFCDVHLVLLAQSKAVHPSLNSSQCVQMEYCTCFQLPVQGEINVSISVDLSGARISPTQSKLNVFAFCFGFIFLSFIARRSLQFPKGKENIMVHCFQILVYSDFISMDVEKAVKLVPKYCFVTGKVMKYISCGQKITFGSIWWRTCMLGR